MILSDRVRDPSLAEDLRLHATERNCILENLSKSFQDDQRIRAAWLWGSFMRGEQDDLSDLDLWLLVGEGQVNAMAKAINDYCQGAGTVVIAGENKHNSPPDGGYMGVLMAGTHGLHHLDIYWQPVSVGEVPVTPVLLNRIDEQLSFTEAIPSGVGGESDPKFRGCIAFVWLMLSVAAKHLARDPSSDMSLLSYPRNCFEETVAELKLGDAMGEVNWTAGDDPQTKVNLMRHIAERTKLIEEACRTQGIDISSKANPCLMRYFDLVSSILLEQVG